MKTKGDRLLTFCKLEFVALVFNLDLMSATKNYISFIISVVVFCQTDRFIFLLQVLSPDTLLIVDFCTL